MNRGDRGVKEKQTLTVDHRRPPIKRDQKFPIKKLLIHLNILNTLKEYA